MKAYFTPSPATRSVYAESIPQWVSEMGLEWLYLLLVSNSGEVKGPVRG
ncbi:MAG: WecB/TagA/CpsF family glycosyltransferase [Pegethrix bostrychoides GSE-TBD4-15B]|jgi:hypothetical protein|uniref:WecB/TagA/CpsF family glycosyltransferase n=1 Tax=Pegethrix bostrychoides GSE-TBD4-15B TaxID=2839662 RepID=A0A951PE42_9CYAN|nr:WecB/TagA/CpsF family glycosyltransferase [Pegethrix bostrychoides GSE-TBD4-15B]